MRRAKRLILLVALALCARTGWGGSSVFEYPTTILDLYDPDASCWTGMDASGTYPSVVVPERWLAGPPLSVDSAVTIPTDHWLDMGFSGALAAGDGNDIWVVETGKAGEQALLFLTDGADREYLLTKMEIEPLMVQELSSVGIDLKGVSLPFEPRALRIVALDMGGLSPGFDLSNIRARVSHDCGPKACGPSPINGASGVPPDVPLSWISASSSRRDVVYLSGSVSQVMAGAASVAQPPQPADVNTFYPQGLQLGRTYYWRVDGLGSTQETPTSTGNVWSFTVADHVTVDDFEAYVDEPPIWEPWRRGGHADLALEQEVLDDCQHSMVFSYYCDSASHSMVSRYFDAPQDWTQGGACVLQLLFHGDLPDPAVGELYVVLTDGVGWEIISQPVVTDLMERPPWRTCRIPLADLGGTDLTQIRGMILGVRAVSSVRPGDSCAGVLNIAEIGLYDAGCLDAVRPWADLTSDCRVDYRDVSRMAADWLREPTRVLDVALPRDPIAWYEFDGNANDRLGRAHGQILGRCNFTKGVFGDAIHFFSQGDAVTIPQAASVFGQVHDAITIAFWQWGDDSGHRNDTICCSNYVYGESNPAIAIHLGCWRDPGQYRWDCGQPWSFDNRLAGRHRDKSEWTGRWNHWAFTKDACTDPNEGEGYMEIYLNGELYDRLTGTDTPIRGITSFEFGSGWYGHYDGLIDDVQIYDYALSAAEVAFVATDGSGVFRRPASPADLNDDEQIDLRDFAALALKWLRDDFLP